MRNLLILTLLSSVACSVFPQAATPASRRYKEPTPLQMVFGAFTKPTTYYNNAGGYTAVPDGQIEPSQLNLDTNNFPSSTGLNLFKPSFATGIGSFGVASNTVTFTMSGNQGILLTDTASVYTIPFAQVFAACKITQNGTAGAGTADSIGCGIGKDGSNWIIAHHSKSNSSAGITIDIAGTVTNLANTTGFATPTAPWYLGFSLVGNQSSLWYSSNGTTWNLLNTVNVASQNDFTAVNALTGWSCAMESDLASGSSTWQMQQLKCGAFGGVGIRDIRFVNFPDGRPYLQGSLAYLTADVAGIVGSTGVDTSQFVFTYDLVSSALTPIGVLFSTRGGIVPDQAGQIIYDTQNNIERFVNVAPGTATSRYTSQTITTDDWLTPGYHIAPSSAAMTLPYDNANNWDPALACTSWNYSAKTCSLWQLAYSGPAGSSHTHIASSTSDPSVNSWTGIVNDTLISGYEGTTIIRSATGSPGVQYTTCIAGPGTSNKCYNQAGGSLGALNVTQPTPTTNPPWPAIACFKNTCYFITFDAGLFGTTAETMGNFTVSTASRY